jgi:hypothetical protein
MRLTISRMVSVAVLTASMAAAFALGHIQATAAQQPSTVPTVVSGSDIGFRLDPGHSTPTGRLVVRLNGQWVEPKWAGGVTLLK